VSLPTPAAEPQILNTCIIMTFNIGSAYLMEGIDQDGHISDVAREHVVT
jgi:ATP-dependent Clp protease ATP-binding subunit ClpA